MSRCFLQEALGKPVAMTEFGKRDHGGTDNEKRAQMFDSAFGRVQSSLATHGSFAGAMFWTLVSDYYYRSPSGGVSWSTCPHAVPLCVIPGFGQAFKGLWLVALCVLSSFYYVWSELSSPRELGG
jgi:hypothetical protein